LSSNEVVIIANGPEPKNRVVQRVLTDESFVIAADGGLRHCRALNRLPNVVIGDLDSVLSQPIDGIPREMFLEVHDQNRTDVQKALDFAVKLKPKRIHLLAALGARHDHTLSNVLILNRFDEIPLYMWDDYGCFYGINAGGHTLECRSGETVSLFSLTGVTGIDLSGFEFTPRESEFSAGFNGVSNRALEDKPRISFTSGRLIVYEQKWREQ